MPNTWSFILHTFFEAWQNASVHWLLKVYIFCISMCRKNYLVFTHKQDRQNLFTVTLSNGPWMNAFMQTAQETRINFSYWLHIGCPDFSNMWNLRKTRWLEFSFYFYEFLQWLPMHFKCNLCKQCIKCSNVLIAVKWMHTSLCPPSITCMLFSLTLSPPSTL